MSTILDALKKSEQERKLNKLPTLTDMQAPQEPSRWPKFVAVVLSVLMLLSVSIGGLLWWQSRSDSSSKLEKGSSTASQSTAAANVDVAKSQDGLVTDNNLVTADNVVVNVVSFSEKPEQRFAMINGKMVSEVEFVEAGLLVEKIER